MEDARLLRRARPGRPVPLLGPCFSMVLAAAVYLPGPLQAQGDGPEAPTHRFEDEVPPGEASHFFLPFEVPEGIAEIEV
ncbi:MAG TPA: hypothetical protein RMF84_05365, partial [Polyangiaceae bacterium LLY-WYZ-14_1]|nr:hypothetical protein [Polyangiaceae bacterium LLY-WYZ-14_1]